VGYFKVDVNGAEPFVIYGARETIKRNLPVVVVELDKDRINTFKTGWARSHQVSGAAQGLRRCCAAACWPAAAPGHVRVLGIVDHLPPAFAELLAS
jgi:hypothetical protein